MNVIVPNVVAVNRVAMDASMLDSNNSYALFGVFLAMFIFYLKSLTPFFSSKAFNLYGYAIYTLRYLSNLIY